MDIELTEFNDGICNYRITMKPCGICSKEWVACKNENIINRDTRIVERNHLMPFTSLYADSKGSYHNFFFFSRC